jgi:hypothetical protein
VDTSHFSAQWLPQPDMLYGAAPLAVLTSVHGKLGSCVLCAFDKSLPLSEPPVLNHKME